MFPIKRFIQGPSLHEETISYAGSKPPKSSGTLNGDEASQAYVEILSLPSTAAVINEGLSSVCLPSSSSTFEANKHEKVPSVPSSKPKLSKLMSCCESNDYGILEKYLQDFETEIDIDSTDEFGWTMLMSASCAGATECVSILLQCGADWTIMDRKGMTALCIARKNKKSACCQLLQEWFQCYIEYQRRVTTGTTDSSDQPCSSSNTSEGESSASTEYCESCKFHFSSSRDLHEKSIAHLVSTAQFGNDKVHFGIPESNKGFQLMLKGGWDKSSGLGPDGTGHKFPVKTILKRDKLGLGNEKEKKAARITHFGPFDSAAVEGPSTRVEREVVTRRREAAKQRNKERLKEIDFRREFSAL